MAFVFSWFNVFGGLTGQVKFEKVLIACHKSEEEPFLTSLQEKSIIHLTQKEKRREVKIPDELPKTLQGISSGIDYLTGLLKKKGFFEGLISVKKPINQETFDSISKNYQLELTLKKIERITQELSNIDSQEKTITNQTRLLTPWKNLQYDFQELKDRKAVEVLLGIFPEETDFLKAQEKLKDKPFYFEVINEEDEQRYCLVTFPKSLAREIKGLLLDCHFEIFDFSNLSGVPKGIIEQLTVELKELSKRKELLLNESQRLIAELFNLQTLYDYYLNLQKRYEVKEELFATTSVVFIEGWVARDNFSVLEKLARAYHSVVVEKIEPEPGEAPPVLLKNRLIFKPFEVVVDLYGAPSPYELDPTPFLAPFFAIFFSLCLTDAGYGIVLILLSILIMKKLKTGRKFLTLLAICGGVTIIAGAVTGGWFGDIFDKVGLSFLKDFKNRLIIFDPIKNPMPFFIISLAIGYLHLIYGILIEVYDSIRQKNYGGAVFEQLPWFLLLNSILGLVFSGKYLPITLKPVFVIVILLSVAMICAFTRREREILFNQLLFFILILSALGLWAVKAKFLLGDFLSDGFKYLSLASFGGLFLLGFYHQFLKTKPRPLIIILLLLNVFMLGGYILLKKGFGLVIIMALLFIFAEGRNRIFLKNFAWGLFSLYGATSFIGIVLSYIRLMALGMVTGGIAMAINTIAWMVIKIPIIGIILALVILIFGHIYNIAINVLGAFVHSLRLNYVEFFPRFFTGGGEKFSPFKRETKYVEVR